MAQTAPPTKRERLEARITSDQKKLIQRAAELEGRSVTDFVVHSVQAAAEATVRRHTVITLSERDSIAFVEALLNPASPNAKLLAAAQDYREFVGEQ